MSNIEPAVMLLNFSPCGVHCSLCESVCFFGHPSKKRKIVIPSNTVVMDLNFVS